MTRIKSQFQGLSSYRCKDNAMEQAFAEAWQEFNSGHPEQRPRHFEYLLDPTNQGRPDPPLSTRDWLVAATVIQWLGSPVGLFFLGKVFGFDRSIVEVLTPWWQRRTEMDEMLFGWKGKHVSLGTFMGGMESLTGRLLEYRAASCNGPYWVCIDIESGVRELRRPTWFCLGPLMGIALTDDD